jgi:DNA-binding transcriptional LysR family regulator
LRTIETFKVSMLELRLLRYFVAVAETEHVGRAAQRLHISQSPLSRQIRQLEDDLGVQLFERANRQIKLTPAGRRVLASARDLLGRAEAFERGARSATVEDTRISVGFVTTALATGVLPQGLRALRKRHPDLQLELRHQGTETQLAAVHAGQLDVAFVHRSASVRGLLPTRVLEQPYRLAVAKGSRLARGPLTPDALGVAPWIAIRAGDAIRDRWIVACVSAGFVPKVAVEVADFASAIALVDAGAGVALLPASQRPGPQHEVVCREVPWLQMRSELWAVTRAIPSPIAADLVALAGRQP